jgi:hypothetical protein
MADVISSGQVTNALVRYQQARLGPAARHVSGSEQATAAYLAQAGV